jgi:quinol monooxygenase YgiN
MINIVAFITPKTEFYGECKQRITDVLSITKAEEGCIRFEIYENQATKQLVFVETFLNQAALDEHYAQPYVLPIFEFYQTALKKEPEIHKLSLIE